MHDEIEVVPEGVSLRGLPGFPDPLREANQTIVRNFQNSYSVRLGGELEQDVSEGIALGVRGGASYESSAIPPEYMSVLTVDAPKLTLGLGGSVAAGSWRFDVVFAHIFGWDVEVAPEDAKSPLLSPIESRLAELHAVNGGTYSARANVVGLGLRYSFGDAPADAASHRAAAPSGEESSAEEQEASDDAAEQPQGDDDDGGAGGAADRP